MTESKKLTIKDLYEDTADSWEESGSLIRIYKCKICGDDVNGYARSGHLWYHQYFEDKND